MMSLFSLLSVISLLPILLYPHSYQQEGPPYESGSGQGLSLLKWRCSLPLLLVWPWLLVNYIETIWINFSSLYFAHPSRNATYSIFIKADVVKGQLMLCCFSSKIQSVHTISIITQIFSGWRQASWHCNYNLKTVSCGTSCRNWMKYCFHKSLIYENIFYSFYPHTIVIIIL